MRKIKDKRILLKKISLLICFILLIALINVHSTNVNATDNPIASEPTFTVQMNPITPNPAKVGEDITVSGIIKPQPFETTTQKKQIILVLDVSGSMVGDKITKLKTAANNFVKKMKDVPNVEIAIVAYSDEATINPSLYHYWTTDWWGRNIDWTYSQKSPTKNLNGQGYKIPDYKSESEGFIDTKNNSKKLTDTIDCLEALGGTNTGEGLRKAECVLENGDATANKSIVFMSDGLPTFYSVNENKKNNNDKYTNYTTVDNSNPSYAGNGSSDPDGKSKTYATTIGSIIKNKNPNVFSIGYGLNTTDGSNSIMQDIHKSMGGTTGMDGTFFATDGGAIDGVFNKIADKIIEKYTLSDMKINLNLDSNFNLNAGGKVVDIGNINYTLQKRTDGKIVYEAAEIPFTFTIKGTVQGTYDNILKGSKLTVPWNGKSSSTDMPKVGVTVTDTGLPIINANIVSQSPNPSIQSQAITLRCEVKPESFEFNSSIFDVAGPKDVIFVVDTSKGMSDKIDSVKNGIFGKITNNTEIKNAKYGMVTFDKTTKNNYIPNGLTDNVATLDSAIKTISCSTESIRDIGTAMTQAKTIFSASGRSNSSKYIILIASDNVQYTDDQLTDIENSKFKVITVNLGYITPPTKVNNQIIAGATEPNNNIKALHYNLIGKQDNGDNILQKEDNNYYININYSGVTNQSNPNEFFTKEDSMNKMNTSNEINNWVLPLVSDKIKNGTVQIQIPSYTFKTKLKFKLQGKFDSISGFNSCSDTGYDVETPEFDVTYNLVNGVYVADTILDKSFTIKIKPNTDIKDLEFGPGIVSYTNVVNKLTSVNINSYPIILGSPIEILKHGLYEGIIDKKPSITDKDEQEFNLVKGLNVNFGATMLGSINNDTGVRLEVANEVEIDNGGIRVFQYDENGNLSQIGTMLKQSSDNIKATYIYNETAVSDANAKILILYSGKLSQTSDKDGYINSLFVPDGHKDVKIKITDKLPELF